MEHICTCNNCGGLFLDTNPQTDAKKFDVDNLQLEELIDHKCPICLVDDFLDDEVAKVLWGLLGDIPVTEDDELDAPFLHFQVGDDKFDVWHWFEETFDLSVAKDLMGLE